MLSLVKATMPVAMNTTRHSSTIGRRVRPNATMPLSTAMTSKLEHDPVPKTGIHFSGSCSRSARRGGERVAQEQRALGRDQLAGLQACENLVIAVALHADLHGALGEAAAVGRDPHGHRAVAL